MHEIVEHLGIGLLELFAVVGIVAIVVDCIEEGGVLSNIIAGYMQSLCG